MPPGCWQQGRWRCPGWEAAGPGVRHGALTASLIAGPSPPPTPSSPYAQHFASRAAEASGGQAAAPPRSALPWNSYTSRQSPVCFQHNGLLIIFAYPLYECYQTVRQLPSQPASSESVSK